MKTNTISIRRHTMKKLTAILFLLLCTGTLAEAQVTLFPSLDYNLSQAYSTNTTGFTDYTNDTHIKFNLISSAANGYGVWGVTKDRQWVLLGNSLQNEDKTLPQTPIPSGVIATGQLLSTDPQVRNIKVATNMNGCVRFVGVGGTSDVLYIGGIGGFNPGIGDTIDFRFPLSVSANGHREIIKSRNVQMNPLGIKQTGLNTVVSYDNSPFWQDAFDIAMDVNYLYIVFYHELFTGTLGQEKHEIWTIVIDLKTNQVIPMADPTPFSYEWEVTKMATGSTNDAVRPTVACNVLHDGLPRWDIVAFNWNQQQKWSEVVRLYKMRATKDGNGKFTYATDNLHTFELLKNTGGNANLSFEPRHANGTTILRSYSKVSHARLLIKPRLETGDNPLTVNIKGLYVISDPVDTDAQFPGHSCGNLYFHRITENPGTTEAHDDVQPAEIICGIHTNDISYDRLRVAPLQTRKRRIVTQGNGTQTTYYENVIYKIIDEPVTAVVNPYDGENTSHFDEFHCVFRMIQQGQTYGDQAWSFQFQDGSFGPYVDDTRPYLMVVSGCNNGCTSHADDPFTQTTISNYHEVSPSRLLLLNRTKINDTTYASIALPASQDDGVGNDQLLCPYTAAINQMGFHIYYANVDSTPSHTITWRYIRDVRSFDEPIIENTLVTNQCFIADGTPRSGMAGATLMPNKTMILWTDPNFNNHCLFLKSASFQPHWQNAQLIFGPKGTTDLVFNIGDNTSTSTTHAGASLVLPQNFELQFSPGPVFENPTVSVNAKSTVEYYGVPIAGPSNDKDQFRGSGTITISGGTVASGSMIEEDTVNHRGLHPPTSLNKPGILNLHAGATFFVSNNLTLKGEYGLINAVYENDNSLYSNPGNIKSMGWIDASGTVSLNGCSIQNLGIVPNATVFSVLSCKSLWPGSGTPNYFDFPQTQLRLTNCLVTCSNVKSRLEIGCNTNITSANVIAGDGGAYHVTPFDDDNERLFVISGGKFSNATFFFADPVMVTGKTSLFVEDAAFRNVRNFGLYLFRSSTFHGDYINISINNCFFKDGAQVQSRLDLPRIHALRIEGFDNPLQYIAEYSPEPVYVNRIDVTDCGFQNGDTAIYLINSNVAVTSNTISGYPAGIVQTNGTINSTQRTSFFCSNNIINCTSSNSDGRGIIADTWAGLSKLNTISNSDIGFTVLDNTGDCLLNYCTVRNSNAQGILIKSSSQSAQAQLDASNGGNIIELNNVTAAGISSNSPVTGQIEINNGTLGIRMTNNIIRRSGSQPNDKFIYHPGSSSIAIGLGGDGRMDSNYWADNSSSSTAPFTAYTPSLSSPDAAFQNITYSSALLDANQTGYYTNSTSCSGTNQSTLNNGKHTHHSLIQDVDTCNQKLQAGFALNQSGAYQEAYDAFRGYIENCYYVPTSYTVFSNVSGENSKRSDDKHRFEEYREWLKKVLYYSPDSLYYCADVYAMLSTLEWYNDEREYDLKAGLAITEYILQSGKCPGDTAYYLSKIPPTWDAIHQAWLDTVKDPIKTPFDSTLPTLEDLGLGILRGNPAEVRAFNDRVLGPLVSNAYATENPFTSETTLLFHCRETVALKFEVFDILGNSYYQTNKLFDKGENSLQLSGTGLPHGQLYGRFSAPDGTVVTIKLRHY